MTPSRRPAAAPSVSSSLQDPRGRLPDAGAVALRAGDRQPARQDRGPKKKAASSSSYETDSESDEESSASEESPVKAPRPSDGRSAALVSTGSAAACRRGVALAAEAHE